MERNSVGRGWLFAAVVLSVVVLDFVTKQLAVWYLPPRVPEPVLGMEWLRLTLVYNRGAAFGLHLGHDGATRFIFIGLTLVALVILWRLFVQTGPAERLRALAISLVVGGAIGNLIDRVRSAEGVVDFLDVGVGATRWPTFNVADMAVSVGAIALATVLWREDRAVERSSPQSQRLSAEGAPPAHLDEPG